MSDTIVALWRENSGQLLCLVVVLLVGGSILLETLLTGMAKVIHGLPPKSEDTPNNDYSYLSHGQPFAVFCL